MLLYSVYVRRLLKALPYDTSWFERANAGELGGVCYDKEERKLTPLLFVPASPRDSKKRKRIGIDKHRIKRGSGGPERDGRLQ